MKDIIRKAVEGGYNAVNSGLTVTEYNLFKEGKLRHQIFILDPLFWQALGKACNWGNYWTFRPLQNIKEDRVNGKVTPGNWVEHHALKFHEINLTDGWNKAVEYLKKITIS